MGLAESPLVPRDSGAGAASGSNGSSNTLTTGAIAGIACGAGALFLGAAGLFLIYWRRQRQYDREDNYDAESFDERVHPGAMAPAVTYTMDYKMDDPQHHEDSRGSSSIYAPEKASSFASSPLSPPDMASAMPTHPAYIPRALVRRSSTPSNRSTATTSPPPFPSPPYPPSIGSLSKTQPDDTMIQAYLSAAAAAQEANATNPGGKEGTTISGPLAFPEHLFPPPPGAAGAADEDDGDETAAAATTGGSDGRRAFRSRRLSGGGGKSGHEGEGGKRKGKKWSDRNSGGGGGGGNRHYTEIEIGRGSDIW
ncbi:hypothetical protein C8A05DRAFT_33686 [Staphylotrichum tortipilum]|uniref:Uncharacterized protein n=1 Tax=Staphylotrichum tortipilum TaxID=2831512 RepID=A0AAN6MLG0_9PEZI|nr:hypothetical protein C8A05DRAFT_33686 [Staphylotrichum longicolle]